MRMNGPVTQVEYVLPDDEVIITHTDTASRITYANPAFLSSSEFSLEESIGQPQNIVRHPDMPPEAFADLWSTIRSGNSWTGLVKNRRKNGGFYWVRANVTPMMEGGRIVGYMSVRVKPKRDEVRAAEHLYAALRAGRAGSLCVKEGRIFDRSMRGTLQRLAHPSLRLGTWVVVGFMTLLFAGLGLAHMLTAGFDWTAAACLLGMFTALANQVYIQSNVVRPLINLKHCAGKLMSGDTRTPIPAQGVSCIVGVAQTFEQVRVKLDGVLKDNVAAAIHVRDAVGSVVHANADLSNRTNEHAASLEETAASLEQLTATVSRNTENAHQAARLAQQSSVATTRGREVVTEVHATMVAITESSQRIGEIVGIIDGIAFQTNLLALNAAVEAARAGDQGRGFAVVAQEVRNLAQRSAASAKQIKELIEESGTKVTRGSTLASQAEQSMRQVVESVESVTGVIAEIESASREQSAGIEEINKAITQMDAITQEDAHLAQQLNSTAVGLQHQSEHMLAAISAFSMQATRRPEHATVSQHHAVGAARAPERRVA